MRRTLFVVLAAIAALAITALASAGGKPPTNPNNPVVTFVAPSPAADATVTDGDVTFAFTFNRTPKQVASVTCALSGQASVSGPCDTPVPSPANSKNTSKSGESYTSLANGSYTFTVTLALTGGGVYTATRSFTVDVPPPPCSVENTTTNAPYTDLQAAIDAAVDDDELEVTGTCIGNYVIVEDITLTGIDHDGVQSTLDGNEAGRVITVGAAATAAIDNLRITNGKTTEDSGGGIFNFGALSISGSTITQNTSGGVNSGGGIHTRGPLTVTGSEISHNTASTGAGLFADLGFVAGTVSITDSVISDNGTTLGSGGGIAAASLTNVVILRTSVTGNTASEGGGIRQFGSVTMSLTDSTVTGNTAFVKGGGISTSSGVPALTSTNSTVSGNTPDNCEPDNIIPGCT